MNVKLFKWGLFGGILVLLYLWVAVLMYGASHEEYPSILPFFLGITTIILILLLWGWNDLFVRNKRVGLWMLGASFLVTVYWIVNIAWDNCPLSVEVIVPVLLTTLLVVGVKYHSKKENKVLAPLGSQRSDWLKLALAMAMVLFCYALPFLVWIKGIIMGFVWNCNI